MKSYSRLRARDIVTGREREKEIGQPERKHFGQVDSVMMEVSEVEPYPGGHAVCAEEAPSRVTYRT